ncbi:MAG: GTPase Era [Clostridia bacterium]|nr:GTPase Era [Clostridia bacterium]MDY5559219.1 GTPase Era [Candidatus Heritagella sp.]
MTVQNYEPPQERAAFIAIVGRPNVGKSSLLNRMLGEKVAIVSPKPQTTRTRIMGVYTKGADQIAFLDTPGLLRARNELGQYMVKTVLSSVSGVDACLLVVEAGAKISPADEELIEKFRREDLPAILAINKIDLLEDKTRLMEQIAAYAGKYPFEAVVPVSARDGSGIDELLEELKKLCQPGGHLFPDDTLTDQPERVLAAEMVREKLLRLLDKEIPHGVAVVTERMRERENGVTDVDCVIFTEKDSHKGIIIGKGGRMLKQVGTLARKDMEAFFGGKVNLTLWVRVKEDWRNRREILHTFGFDEKDFEE